MSDNTTNEKAVQNLETKIHLRINAVQDNYDSAKDRLMYRCRQLSDSLLREVDYIETYNSVPNSLGIIQSSGTEIDRLCQEMHNLSEELRRLKSLLL